MDNFLGFWISTIILSAGFNISNDLKAIKDIYESGHKINMNNIDKFDSIDNPSEHNLNNNYNSNILTILIPIINMLEATRERLDYYKNKYDFLELLYTLGIIEEMTDLEKEIYFKHPSIFSAIFLETLVSLRINKSNVIEIRTDNEYGDIYYEYGENISEIKILKATGDMAKISTSAQIEKVKNAIYGYVEQCVDNFMQEIEYKNNVTDELKDEIKKEFIEYAFTLLNAQEKKKNKKRTRKK